MFIINLLHFIIPKPNRLLIYLHKKSLTLIKITFGLYINVHYKIIIL